MIAKDIKALLRKYQIQPKRTLGQNFLIEPAGLDLVLNAAELSPMDTVLEIGAGLGTLTRELALMCNLVFAIEIDKRLELALEEVLRSYSNVEIIFDDFLKLDLSSLVPIGGYKVVANIPYYITSLIMRKLMMSPVPPDLIVLTVQSEVAQRVIAKPGKMNLLALSVQIFGVPRVVGRIPSKSFYPAPDVDSAVLKVRLLNKTGVDQDLIDEIFTLAQAGFSQKRKKLRNSLSTGLGVNVGEIEALLSEADLDPTARAQELSVQDWERLAAIRRGGSI